MDVTLQRHCAKYIYVIPEGLKELMSDISREVLRSQPEEIYTFIADYLDALLITRENARVAARFVDSLTEISTTIVDLLIKAGMNREEADKVSSVIQVAFRKHLVDKTAAMRRQQQQYISETVDEANIITKIIDEAGVTPEQAEHATLIIQNAYRNFKHRQEIETDLLKGMVDWRVAARSTMRLYRKTGVTYEEANRAATLIKAAYKGYYTRRIMKRLLKESESVSEEKPISVVEEEEGSFEYIPYRDGFEQEAVEAEIYEAIEEVTKGETEAPPEPEEDTETMVSHIMDNLLKRAVLDSSTTIPSGFVTPPPSFIESEGKTRPFGSETPDETAETASEMIETPIQDISPGEAVTQEGEAAEATAAEVLEASTEEEAATEVAEAPPSELASAPTEVIMSPEASEAVTDTENADPTASQMQSETETDVTTTEDN